MIICSFIEKQLCLHGKFLRYLRSNGKNTYKNVRKNTVIVDFIIFHFLNL